MAQSQSVCSLRDTWFNPESKDPLRRKGANPLQYSCLNNPDQEDLLGQSSPWVATVGNTERYFYLLLPFHFKAVEFTDTRYCILCRQRQHSHFHNIDFRYEEYTRFQNLSRNARKISELMISKMKLGRSKPYTIIYNIFYNLWLLKLFLKRNGNYIMMYFWLHN